MDHLPYPNNAILPPIRIPYLCADVERYDGLDLIGFASRMGWTDWSLWSSRETARIQSWLYFGLLAELFGPSFDENEFIENSIDGKRYITTRKLPALLKDRCQENSRFYQWAASMGIRDKSQKGFLRGRPYVRLSERVATALGLAQEQSNLLEATIPPARLIALSIKVLIWSVGNALCTYLPSRKQMADFKPRPSRILRSRMLDGGKCPYWTEIYLQRYSVAMVYYLAAVPFLHGNVDHHSCSLTGCTAHDIDEQQYTIKHVQDDCQCDMVAPDVAKISNIIEKNGVPLVRLKVLPSGLLDLDVVQGQYGKNYTAISHVWSGGLGNPSSNSLPQCQLRNIRQGLRLAREIAHEDARLYPPGFTLYRLMFHRKKSSNEVFWMDTFCIPVSLGKILRRKAISQMNFIFAGADNVLVIDPRLQTLEEKSLSKLQLRLQVACSPWMSRCWTFQEACLARAWHIDLRSTLYEPAQDYHRETDPMFRIWTARSVWTDESELEREAISFYNKLWPLVDQRPGYKPSFWGPETDNAEEFTTIWRQLNERSTTRRVDRLIILAILLDLNPGEIMSLELSEQMRAILRTQNTLPLSLLFEGRPGPMVENAKCRWIPLYPKGDMTTEYGCMSRSRASSYYQFTLSGIKAYGLLIDAKDSKHRQFRIDKTSPLRLSAKIRAMPHEGVAACPAHGSYCIILSQMKKHSTELGSFSVGARFVVEEISSDKRSCRLVYDCPVEYVLDTSFRGPSFSNTEDIPKVDISTQSSRQDAPPASDVWHQIEASLMPDIAEISIDCDMPNWYVPRFSRAKTMGLRKHVGLQSIPYVGLLSGLILAIWILSVAFGTFYFVWATFKQGLKFGVLYAAGVPVILLGIASIRAAIWTMAESHRMLEFLGERQYHQWANTFGESNDSERPGSGISDSRPLSYQYRPWWLAAVLVVGSLALLVVALKVRVVAWATPSAAALLAETVLRVVLEQLWLRTRLGKVGKQLRLRWLPWLSIPIRQ